MLQLCWSMKAFVYFETFNTKKITPALLVPGMDKTSNVGTLVSQVNKHSLTKMARGDAGASTKLLFYCLNVSQKLVDISQLCWTEYLGVRGCEGAPRVHASSVAKRPWKCDSKSDGENGWKMWCAGGGREICGASACSPTPKLHTNSTPLAAPLAHHTKTPKLHTTTSSTLASEKRRPFCSFQNVNFIITG